MALSMMRVSVYLRCKVCAMTCALLWALTGVAGGAKTVNMNQVLNGAIAQPQVNAIIRPAVGAAALSAPGLGVPFDDGIVNNIPGFFDTGAGTILLGSSTSASYSLPIDPGVIFTDVGVAGSEQFNVSNNVVIQLASFDLNLVGLDPAPLDTIYDQIFTGQRAAVGPAQLDPIDVPIDPINQIIAGLSEFIVFGTPLMKDKTVVMDSRIMNQAASSFDVFGDLILAPNFEEIELKTYVYDSPNAPSPRTPMLGPGIPDYDVKIKTQYGSFDDFTTTTGGAAPSLAHNPFIGPLPASIAESGSSDNIPQVAVTHNGGTSKGSWLYDTGAAAPIWSLTKAGELGISYSTDPGKGFGEANPELVGLDAGVQQFTLTLSGIGGSINVAGFFAKELIIPAFEGVGQGGEQRVDLRFTEVPLLVADITLAHPVTGELFTLDGIMGMNFFFPSIFLDGDLTDLNALFAVLEAPMVTSNFDFMVFDEPTGNIMLTFNRQVVPEPATLLLLSFAALMCIGR